jgi:hypothetical protein
MPAKLGILSPLFGMRSLGGLIGIMTGIGQPVGTFALYGLDSSLIREVANLWFLRFSWCCYWVVASLLL